VCRSGASQGSPHAGGVRQRIDYVCLVAARSACVWEAWFRRWILVQRCRVGCGSALGPLASGLVRAVCLELTLGVLARMQVDAAERRGW